MTDQASRIEHRQSATPGALRGTYGRHGAGHPRFAHATIHRETSNASPLDTMTLRLKQSGDRQEFIATFDDEVALGVATLIVDMVNAARELRGDEARTTITDLKAESTPAGRQHPSALDPYEQRPYDEATDHEHAAWEVDDLETHALDLLAVVRERRRQTDITDTEGSPS